MRQLTLLYLSACLCLSATFSCKKELSPQNVASLTIINALPGNRLLLADLSGKQTNEFAGAGIYLYYGAYDPNTRLSVTMREQPMAFYKYPFADGDQPLYQLSLHPKHGEISTLFLAGTQHQPEHLVINEKPPHYAVRDSLVGLRFINLSAGSSPVQVKISGQGINPIVLTNNLAYKNFTTYLPVMATSNVGDLLVEFFDQASDRLIASFPLAGVGATLTDNPWRYRNYTLVLKGLPNAVDADNAQGVFKIDDY